MALFFGCQHSKNLKSILTIQEHGQNDRKFEIKARGGRVSAKVKARSGGNSKITGPHGEGKTKSQKLEGCH